MINKSDRLYFEKFKKDLYTDYCRLNFNEDVMKYITGKALTAKEAEERFRKTLEINRVHPELGFFAVRKSDDQTFMGLAKLVHFSPEQLEIGYSLLPEFWGQRYASEIADFLISKAGDFPEIIALVGIIDPDNMVSRKLLTSRGFETYDANRKDDRPTEYLRLILPHRKLHENYSDQ